jgi:hypothetical protein
MRCQARLDFVTCLFLNFSSASSSPLSTFFDVFIPLFTKINHPMHTAALRGAKLRPPTVSIVSRVDTAHCEKMGKVLLREHFINHHLLAYAGATALQLRPLLPLQGEKCISCSPDALRLVFMSEMMFMLQLAYK